MNKRHIQDGIIALIFGTVVGVQRASERAVANFPKTYTEHARTVPNFIDLQVISVPTHIHALTFDTANAIDVPSSDKSNGIEPIP